MINLPNEELIYYERTKQYFNEVMSDYANGNYRSATVLLYSVVICDLLYKLQELSDVYDDKIAEQILRDVYDNRHKDGSRSRWEKEFVESVHRKTNLLDELAYAELNHLYDHRNFSAHPALNENYELISPSRETTISHINNMLNNIFIKPPVFASNVIDMLTEDLANEKILYEKDTSALKKYLDKKYFDRMPEIMKKKCFKTFWKFCFFLNEDKDCEANRLINRRVLEILMDEIPEILEYIKSDTFFMNIPFDQNTGIHFVLFVSRFPEIYNVISDEIKLLINKIIDANHNMEFVAWFRCKDKKEHIKILLEDECFGKGQIDIRLYNYMREMYDREGELYIFLDACILEFEQSWSYDEADKRYVSVIRPSLDRFSKEQFIKLLEVINVNSQIYNRGAAFVTNGEIIKASQKYLQKDFDYAAYSNIRFDINILNDIKEQGLDVII